MTVMTSDTARQRDAQETAARERLAELDPSLAGATAWNVYRTVADEEQFETRTYSAEAALAYARTGCRVEAAA